MKRIYAIAAIAALVLISCGPRKTRTDTPATPMAEASPFDALSVTGDPFMLTSGNLTGQDAILSAFRTGKDGYVREGTPVEQSFLYLEDDIRKDSLARKVLIQYNLAAVLNRCVHAYELFERMSTATEEDHKATRRDTLEWLRVSQPGLFNPLIWRVIPDHRACVLASDLVDAYRRFDGDSSPDGDYAKAFKEFIDGFKTIPDLVPEGTVDAFADSFWKWYDKSRHVPEIDGLVSAHLKDSSTPHPDSLQVDRLKRAAMGERDIDRRAVLALELAQWDRWEGVLLLGDIMESGIWTKYLLEVWISWRANLQMEHSPSSFGVIPNCYYDRLRAKCINTWLRHLQADGDDIEALCMLENLIYCEVVHRMASLAGNESFATQMHLAWDEFIDPRLLEEG